MKKQMLFGVAFCVFFLALTTSASAHQSEYTYCAAKRGGRTYALDPYGTHKGWRTECRPGDTLVQEREIVRTDTCMLFMQFRFVICQCQIGETAAFSRALSASPEELVHTPLEVGDITVWLPELTTPEQYLLLFAEGEQGNGTIEIEYTCTSH